MGAPSFGFFGRAGHENACACGLFRSLRNKSYSTGSIAPHPFDRLRAGSCKKRKDGAPPAEMLHTEMVKSRPPARSLNRKRRIAFYHLLLEIRTFVLAPELCSVSNPIENRSAIRLVLANDGTRQADELRLQPVRCCVHYRIPVAAHVNKRHVR